MATLSPQTQATSPGRLGPAPIRVGFVLHVMQVAGAEVFVAETIRRLTGQVTSTVFCLDGVGPIGHELLTQGVEVVHLGRRPGRDLRVAWRLAREARRRGIEVLHAHQYTPFFYAALAKLLMPRRPRLVLTEHGRHYPDVASPTRRAANRLALGHLADAITGVCAFSLRGLCEVDGFPDRKAEVIDNGIRLERYGPAADRATLRAQLGLDPGRRYVANIARLHPVKDQATLVRGFRAAAAGRPDVDLLLVGDGPLRAELEGMVADVGLVGRVLFLGVRPDVPDLLRAADVFALTSVSEAASLTLLEAMATGLPVVVTDVGGNPELVRGGVDGMLVPRADADAVGVALGKLLDDPAAAAALGRSGRARVEERFRLERTIDAYFDLYRRLARPGGR